MFAAGRCHHQRVDLDQAGIGVEQELRELEHDADRLGNLLAPKAEAKGQLPGLIRLKSEQWVQLHLVNRLGAALGHGLDLHPALGRGDHRVGVVGAINGNRQVVFLGDVHACDNQQSLDLEPCGRGLRRHHSVGEHELRGFAGLLGGPDELDEPGLASPPGVNLCLDHDAGRAGVKKLLRLGLRFVNRLNHGPARNRDPRFGKQLTGLILVDLHKSRSQDSGVRG